MHRGGGAFQGGDTHISHVTMLYVTVLFVIVTTRRAFMHEISLRRPFLAPSLRFLGAALEIESCQKH